MKNLSILSKVLFSQEETINLADFAGVNLIMVIEKSNNKHLKKELKELQKNNKDISDKENA